MKTRLVKVTLSRLIRQTAEAEAGEEIDVVMEEDGEFYLPGHGEGSEDD